MIRISLVAMILLTAVGCSPVFAQESSGEEATDLKVELRSITGSNTFQLGEVIPLEVLISSQTPHRYLEPCKMFWESCFGYPQCRFATIWSFDVMPNMGWEDVGWHGCGRTGGARVDVKSSDLTAEPKKYPYTLTNKFRFDSPGTYTVRLSIKIGLDDDSNQIGRSLDSKVKQNSVSKTAEIVLEIIPAGETWKRTIIERGVSAWANRPPVYTNPPSVEYSNYEKEKAALCNLGTPEAAVALTDLLSRDIDVTHCLNLNSNKEVEQAEMSRLLVDPNVGIRPMFFSAYTQLLRQRQEKSSLESTARPKDLNDVRGTLFASLPSKTHEAMILSLETLLRNPMVGNWPVQGSPYDPHAPFSSELIAMAAANFDHFSADTQAMLLDINWDRLQSPLMLPIVRAKAEAGNGQALLRWLELEPAAATAFMRQEIVRPAPRFSSLYLRLPDESLPGQEQQIAANFVTLAAPEELVRAATLLHRYTTRATLHTVLPFIDRHLDEWPCVLQIPVLGYLLKVSPDEARPRVERVLQKVSPPYCPRGEFLPSLGHVEASPVLDTLATRQLEDGTPLAMDAAGYLGRYGAPSMKPVVWKQLSHWHKMYKESGAEMRVGSGKITQDDRQLYDLDSRLREAYVNAQGWTLSPADENRLSILIGDEKMAQLACTFSCGSAVAVGGGPGNYAIYGHLTEPVLLNEVRIDYLLPAERFRYSINQYRCDDLKALEQKLLQFPAGSTFRVARTGSSLDGQGDWTNIGTFLKSHGYSFRD